MSKPTAIVIDLASYRMRRDPVQRRLFDGDRPDWAASEPRPLGAHAVAHRERMLRHCEQATGRQQG